MVTSVSTGLQSCTRIAIDVKKPLLISATGLTTCVLVAWLGRELLRNPVADLPDVELKGSSATPVTEILLKQPLTQNWLARLPTYVGSEACRECHGTLCDTYQTHPMSQSFGRTSTAPVIEDYVKETGFSGPVSGNFDIRFHYSVIRDNDRVTHREVVSSSAGEELGRIDADAAWAVGSGKRGRSYLVERAGRLYMSPVTWYSEGQKWDLSPAYSRDNKHFERRIVAGCVVCHASLVEPSADDPNIFAGRIFHEESIGCERCHGPGRDHVAFRREQRADIESDPIVNPADLAPELRDSVCYQCHLQGVGRIARYGKSDYDFEPGMSVADVWTIFVRGTKVAGDNTTAAVGQTEQMIASTCYTASGGNLSCLSCHDPHASPADEARVGFYRERCLTCHDGTNRPLCAKPVDDRLVDSPSDSCIQCHMPDLSANDVPHTSQTDHRIPRLLSTGDQTSGGNTPSPWVVFGNDDSRIPQEEVDRGLGILMARNSMGAGDRFLASRAIPLLQAWLSTHPDDLEVADTLGSAYSVIKDTVSARTVWEAALKHHPDSENLLLHLMVVCHDSEDYESGIRYGERLIAINPWHSQHFSRLTHMLGQSGRIQDGIQTALQAVALKPWDWQIHGWLADSYDLIGNREASDRHFDLYNKLKPLEKN